MGAVGAAKPCKIAVRNSWCGAKVGLFIALAVFSRSLFGEAFLREDDPVIRATFESDLKILEKKH